MPLSEHEQRVFDEIEQSLAEDPKFASAVRSHDPRHRGRRRMVVAGLIVLAGVAMLVIGLMTQRWLSFTGAVVMFAGMGFALQTQRKASSGELSAVGGKATRRTGKSSRRRPSAGGRSGGLGDRLEERWRRRRGDGWM